MYKVLLVDDEPDLLEIYQGHLDGAITAQYTTANNGKDALDKATTESFDLIISDINMPIMNGLELIKMLRERQIYTPFIFITGYGDAEKIRIAWQFGASDFIDKPVNSKSFVSSAQSALLIAGSSKANLEVDTRMGTSKGFVRVDLFLDSNRFKKLKEYCDRNFLSMHTVLTQMIDEKLK